MAGMIHNGRVTDRVVGQNDDLEALFAESQAKASEQNGFALTLGGRTFDVWPGRFSHRDKMRIFEHSGMSLELAATKGRSAPIECMSTIILASMFQTTGRLPGLEGIAAWLRQVLAEADADDSVEWTVLEFDQAVSSDPLERSGIS